MAELEIGYNISQAKQLMEDIAQHYKDLQNNITSEWENVVSTLQQEWIGEDEQDFEGKFADRICELYDNAHKLAQGACQTIADLAESWYKFQASNTLDGAGGGNSSSLTIDIPDLSFTNPIVELKAVTFDEGTSRGLRSSGSATTIQTTVTDYATNVKEAAQNMFSEIQSSNAFFGDQTSSIDAFVAAGGEAIGEVVAAVKDLYTALETLANSNYTSSVQSVTETMGENKTSVETSVDELGESKWS